MKKKPETNLAGVSGLSVLPPGEHLRQPEQAARGKDVKKSVRFVRKGPQAAAPDRALSVATGYMRKIRGMPKRDAAAHMKALAKPLSRGETIFVRQVAGGMNATRAALMAGYGGGHYESAMVQGSRLLRTDKIALAIARELARLSGRAILRRRDACVILSNRARATLGDFCEFSRDWHAFLQDLKGHPYAAAMKRLKSATLKNAAGDEHLEVGEMELHDARPDLSLMGEWLEWGPKDEERSKRTTEATGTLEEFLGQYEGTRGLPGETMGEGEGAGAGVKTEKERVAVARRVKQVSVREVVERTVTRHARLGGEEPMREE